MVLQAQDLACLRGDRRLFRRLQLQAGAGELWRIHGPNGSGKTSLLRLLAGLALPAAGQVSWRGLPIRTQREAFAAELLYLGHLPGLKDELTPLQNLQALAGLQSHTADEGQLLDALAQMGLQREASLPVRVLSAGQRRRAALARLVLARAQTLWILDEPFSALDAASVARLSVRIGGHVLGGGTVLLTTHQEVVVAGIEARLLDVSNFNT